MLQEKDFYGLSNWKCYLISEQAQSSVLSFKQEQIKEQNNHGFVVLFLEKPEKDHIKVECYKKHSTAIIKSIIIGKFPLPTYANFRSELDSLVKQTQILEDYIKKPEFGKYKIQKKLYFNID